MIEFTTFNNTKKESWKFDEFKTFYVYFVDEICNDLLYWQKLYYMERCDTHSQFMNEYFFFKGLKMHFNPFRTEKKQIVQKVGHKFWALLRRLNGLARRLKTVF